jgi:hypothetical protein
MGVTDSPLRDRVIFVVGAPRSGTTLLTTLLAAHPDVAGIIAESYLFDFDRGVGALFDNFEGQGAWKDHVSAYVTREELVDVSRDLCDGVLERMRSRVAPDARFVVEKTPARRIRPKVTLARKLECYPDAWFIHIVREDDAAIRSLMRAPWNVDRSQESSARWWQDAVDGIRAVCADHPRYQELRYEDVASDPVGVASRLFDGLGLDSDDQILAQVAHVSRERFSDFAPSKDEGAPQPREHDVARNGAVVGRLANRARRSRAVKPARRLLSAIGARRSQEKLATEFGEAVRAADPARIAALTGDSVIFALRSPDGDLRAEGADAHRAIAAVSARLFKEQFFALNWTVAPGRPFLSLLFSGMHKGGTRVDLSWNLFVSHGKIVRVGLISAGSLGGRPLRDWLEEKDEAEAEAESPALATASS